MLLHSFLSITIPFTSRVLAEIHEILSSECVAHEKFWSWSVCCCARHSLSSYCGWTGVIVEGDKLSLSYKCIQNSKGMSLFGWIVCSRWSNIEFCILEEKAILLLINYLENLLWLSWYFGFELIFRFVSFLDCRWMKWWFFFKEKTYFREIGSMPHTRASDFRSHFLILHVFQAQFQIFIYRPGCSNTYYLCCFSISISCHILVYLLDMRSLFTKNLRGSIS